MKYTLDSFLPLGAFEHCGNGKIRLHGGGGGGDVFSDIGNAVSDVVSGASDALSQIDPGPAIGDAGQAIDETVNDVIPGGWGMVGAVALSVATAGTVDLEGEALAADAAAEMGPTYAEMGYEGADAASTADAINAADTLSNASNIADTSIGAPADYAGDAAYEAQGLQEGYQSAANPLGDVTNPDGSVTSTFDDGSTITRSATGEVLGNTPAISDPIQLDEVLKAAKYAKTAYNVANTANKLLNPQTGALTKASTLTSAKPSSLSGLSSLSDSIGGPSSTSSGGGALPGSLQATSLAAAPVTQGSSNMNINQLKQLYPQLSTVDPRILSSLTGKAATTPNYYTYGANQSAGGTALTMQGQGGAPQPGYPSISADSKGTSTAFANPTSPSSSYNALSSAGLHAINSGALPGQNYYKDGGNVHIPQFKTGTTGHFVQGAGDGQSDDIPAMLADGEYVFDADTVAALGNGSSKAGALQLDHMRKAIRKHKRSASTDKIPPKAKSPLEYLKG